MSAPRPHLLFVDDEPALRALMAERLGERGFEVAEAESGEKALALLDQFAFDILITDLRMPGVDGTQVIQAARERYPGIVAIVMAVSGSIISQRQNAALMQQVADYGTALSRFIAAQNATAALGE